MTLAIDIQLFRDMPPVEPPSASFDGWRVKHKIEGGWPNTPPLMPEVMPPLNYGKVAMTREIQQLSYDLMVRFNSQITPKKWTQVHDHDRAFTNFSGFAKEGDPRRNYITGENLSSPLPEYDKAQRVCGGSFVRGVAQNGKLYCTPGIHGIDASAPLPDVQTVIDNNWFIYAVYIGSNDNIYHFPQGFGGPVVIPFIFSNVIEFGLQYFEKWTGDTLPDPLKVYL